MDDATSRPQEPAGGSPSDSPPAAGAPPPAPDTAARVREGIAALRGGNRTEAQVIFHSIADAEPRNENAWIGLALSADTAEEAAAAFHTAEEINPGSRFVAQAETDLRNRRPGFADALAAARAGTPVLAEETPAVIAPAAEPAPSLADEAAAATAVVPVPLEATPAAEEPPAAPLAPPPPETPLLVATPRLTSGTPVVAQGGSDARRTLLSAGVVLLGAALIVLLGLALSSGGILQRPTPPTATTVAVLPSATTVPQAANPPTATEAPPPGSPVVNVPPTLPASAIAAGPTTGTGPEAAATLAATLGPDAAAQETALAAVRAGQYATAIPTLEIASERSPGDSETLYYLGVAYLSAPDRPNGAQDAELTFRSLLAQRPDWPPALDMLARSLIAQGRYADAVPFAYKAVQLEPARPEYFITLGRAYEGGGDTADAQKAYTAAARLSGTPVPGVTATAPATGTLTLPATIGAGALVTGTATIVITSTAGLPATAGLTATAGLPALPVITQSPGVTVTAGTILIPVAGTPALDTPPPAATTAPGTATALPATVPASPAASGTATP